MGGRNATESIDWQKATESLGSPAQDKQVTLAVAMQSAAPVSVRDSLRATISPSAASVEMQVVCVDQILNLA